ncbi:MAG TPA: hypothetical protein VFN55_04030 [Solirubrobacteraceae bacterium]|nr:hypothetical protein [Solirubrobacteraceae bacterium]
MILTLNILLTVIAAVGIVGLLAYNIYPLRRPLRLDDAAVALAGTTGQRDATRRAHPDAHRAHPYAARRGHQAVARSLDGARA